jgi:DNA modification methylase
MLFRNNKLAPGTSVRVPVQEVLQTVRNAALDRTPVSGLTHQHYRYPARFSPRFARAAIEAFSEPDDLVLDPYMGGGTTVLEAITTGRRAVGCDINSLAIFVAKAKTTKVSVTARQEVEAWVLGALQFGYRDDASDIEAIFCEERTRNLHSPRSRALKKFIAFALAASDTVGSIEARRMARCAVLNVSQWALNGRKRTPTVEEFRRRLLERTLDILDASGLLFKKVPADLRQIARPVLIHGSAEQIGDFQPFNLGEKADLVVTSPPYPGIHILYHRWQVDGRRESPAPYWIADCLDGQGASYYTFGDRQFRDNDTYFEGSLRTLQAIRAVMRDDAMFVQMIAFSDAKKQLPRYLANMERAGFREMRSGGGHRRIWRSVPPLRNWHADYNGRTSGTREVVLLHKCA